MLTRDEIITLYEAMRVYGLDERQSRALYRLLDGKALRHLGWQGERGWFYRMADVEAALDELPFRSTPTWRTYPGTLVSENTLKASGRDRMSCLGVC